MTRQAQPRRSTRSGAYQTQRKNSLGSASSRRIGATAARLQSVLLLLALAPLAHAQVNTEAFRPQGADEGLSGTFTLDFAARRGNTETERAGLGLNLFRATAFDPELAKKAKRPVPVNLLSAKQLIMLITEYDFEESRGDNTVNQGFVHVRWTYQTSPRIGWEAFSQLETDEFTNLDRRTLVGGGLRYGAFLHEQGTMYWGIGAFGEWERISDRSTHSDNQMTHNVVRISSYLSGRWKHPNERVELSSTTYVQPTADNLDDYRILSQARLTTAITARTALNLVVNLRHDSQPPDNIEQTDVVVKTGFSFKF